MTSVTFTIDTELLKKANQLFDDLGLDISTAFNVFLTQSVNQWRIPFHVSLEKQDNNDIE